jgi:LytS/YehU family sensor histidine kinase
MFTQTKVLPKVLTFSQAKYYFFSLAFVSLAVGVPFLLHQFNLAGPKFLPMHFFVMFAGLLFGWRTGLLVGALSPLMSFGLTQMPAMAILPQVVLELAVYGLVAGLLKEKGVNTWVSLIGAMVLGRAARILFILALAPKMEALQFIQSSIPGIFLQLALVPVAVYLLQKYLFKKSETKI